MGKNEIPFYPKDGRIESANATQAGTGSPSTNTTTLYTAGSQGSKVYSIYLNADAKNTVGTVNSGGYYKLILNDGTNDHVLFKKFWSGTIQPEVDLPQGTDLLQFIKTRKDSNANNTFAMKSGSTLKMELTGTLTNTAVLTVPLTIHAEDF